MVLRNRYVVLDKIGGGGMATVHLGRVIGDGGFTRVVAVKQMLPALAKTPDLVKMFVDEARLAARIHHANVVSTLDVVAEPDVIALVMEYVHGPTLLEIHEKAKTEERVPLKIAVAIAAGPL